MNMKIPCMALFHVRMMIRIDQPLATILLGRKGAQKGEKLCVFFLLKYGVIDKLLPMLQVSQI